MCSCKNGWYNNTMGNFYSEGVRCKPNCQYPYITDETNEVCICDQDKGYYLMFNYWT
jgi:hypothetical protein